MGNKALAEKIAYYIADLEYHEVSTPEILASLLESYLDDIQVDNKRKSGN